MVNSIDKRIAKLKDRITRLNGGKIAAYFKDGSVRLLDGGECVDLVFEGADVERFEAEGNGHGALPDILNDMLKN